MTYCQPNRAAQYIRMSTDAQELSPEIQKAAIADYASAHDIDIVETYFDSGKSGLSLRNRRAMQRLLRDVTQAERSFTIVLVYDISRWGRFQDVDASAYYEYHCRANGVEVRYIREPFADLDSPMASLMKGLKRVMAAEYSRELSVKTRAGQHAAIERGFQLGTLPCLGIARVAVRRLGETQRLLTATEHKAAFREHVRWVPGPPDEVALVRRIFHLYASTDISVECLAHLLRSQGATARGRPITHHMLYTLLRCEAFKGDFVWGRKESGRKRSDGDQRILRITDAIEPIVPRDLWDAAQRKRIAAVGKVRTKDELLADLAEALRSHPGLMATQLRKYGCASRTTYVQHFGSLAAALELVGHDRLRLARAVQDDTHRKRAVGAWLAHRTHAYLMALGIPCERPRARFGSVTVVLGGSVRLRVQPIWQDQASPHPWQLPKVYRAPFDFMLVVRILPSDAVLDSILLGRRDYFKHPVSFETELPATFRFTTEPSDIVRILQGAAELTRRD